MKSENLILKIYPGSEVNTHQNGSDYSFVSNHLIDINIERGFANLRSENNLNSENYFKQIFDTTPEALLILDENGEIINVNKSFEKLFLFGSGEIIGRYLDEFISPAELGGETKKLVHEISRGLPVRVETSRITKEGNRVDVLISGNRLAPFGDKKSGTYLIYTDISRFKNIEKEIKSSLIDKEVLIREIHHRVKNNLQIISSLLHLQSRNIENKPIDEIFVECQNRVKAISLVHEKLYMTNNITRIDFNNYIKSLTTNLLKSFGISSRIRVLIKAENIFLPMDSAISCGLIINELVTNSMKHAFSASNSGEIEIDLKYNSNNTFTMSVKDNGTGLPDNINIENHGSLGFSLIHSLIRQIDAKLETIRNKGTEFKITFSILDNRGGNN